MLMVRSYVLGIIVAGGSAAMACPERKRYQQQNEHRQKYREGEDTDPRRREPAMGLDRRGTASR